MTPDPLAAASRGLAVFPLPPGERRPGPGWQARCTLTPDPATWPTGANVGVGCRASGVVGLDLDRHGDGTDGLATFADLCRTAGQPWPVTLAVATPHGGRHLYLRVPAGDPRTYYSGALAPGIDVRGPGRRSGGYLLGPGSVTDAGEYAVDVDAPIAELPAWLADLLTGAHRPVALR